jgi:hypothetical protein
MSATEASAIVIVEGTAPMRDYRHPRCIPGA